MASVVNNKFGFLEYEISFKKIKDVDQVVFNLMPDPGFLFFPDLKQLVVNQKLLQLFRFKSKQDLIKDLKNGYHFFENIEKSKQLDIINKLANNKDIRPCKFKFIRKDNTFFKGRFTIKPLISLRSNRIYGYYGTIKDIKNETIILSGAKKTFYKLLNDTSDTVIISDFNGRILKANKKFFRINFFAERSIKNYNLFQMIDHESDEILRERVELLRMGNFTNPMEFRLIGDNERPMYVELNSQPIIYRSKKAIITRIRNVSPQKDMERKLFETVLQTEEKEKQGFAQDLHDELGPFLSGIKLYINEIESTKRNKNRRRELIEYLRKMVDEAIAKTKIISNCLMSNILIEQGLSKALDSFVEKMNNMHQISIDLNIENLNDRLNTTSEIVIYRIIIELINNSLKHAKPKKITIHLIKESSFLKTTYADDGIGFNIENELKTPSGIGLCSIINRLDTNHATYSFSSKINEGMQLEFKLPLS